MDISVEVRTAVNEAKKQIKECKTAQEMWDIILQFVLLLDKNSAEDISEKASQNFNSTCGVHYSVEFKKEFISKYYSNFSEHLLIHSDPSFLKDENFRTILARLFLEGPADMAFLSLVSSTLSITHTDKLHTVVSILDDFATGNKFAELFVSKCLGRCPKLLTQELLIVITSLPDKLSNKMRLALNAKFHPRVYHKMLAKEIIRALIKVHEISCQASECTTSFLSELIGKIALRGSAGIVLDILLPQMQEWCYTSPLWSNICSNLLVQVPESSLEPITECLLKKIAFCPFFCKILKDSVVKNTVVKHLITHKFLLVRYYDNPNVLRNIVSYLCGEGRRGILIDVLKTIFGHWGNVNTIKHSSYEQHFYITQAVILGVAQLNESEVKEHKNLLIQKMLSGVQAHLENPNNKIRQLGMVTAECVTDCFHPDGQKLKFEVEEDDDVKKLRALAVAPKFGTEIEKENFLNNKNIATENGLNGNLISNETDGRVEPSLEKSLLGDNDDDDLQPFEMSEGDSDLIEGIRPPRYISQCIDGLLSSDDPKRHIASLSVLKNVIKSDMDNLNYQCVRLVTILLHLQDKYSIENYNELRFSAMVETAIRCPIPVAECLTKEFYAQNYSLRQRMDILDVLVAAATKLSKPDANKGLSTIHANISEMDDNHNWKAIVQERIDKKTRRFSKKFEVVPPTATLNRFASVAGYFFFPLLHGFDNRQNTFDLLGEDCIVLGSLVFALGTVMYCARGTLGAQNMAKSLLEFVWVLRYHNDAHVRQGLLFSLAMVVVSVPGFFLMTEVQSELVECQSWLEHVLQNDPSAQCRELALQVLVSIRDVFHKQFISE